ncbi:PaaI family thioesterase [Breoghania sp. L-A4]|uniref:PaaI family thioesterase n=1 Tax=Breoghania sp. L-A4 TaxID=2304600 RepID=UPI0013C2EF6F|nr:PaaI family thioesterase [Breoghania sp. L-A4]
MQAGGETGDAGAGDREHDGALVIECDSAVMRHMGYGARVYAERTEIDLPIADHHRNRRGVLHGGIIAMLLDSALGYACSRHLADDASTGVVTVSLTTNFMKPAAHGTIRATGRVNGGGFKTLFAEGEIIDEAGDIVATATGVFKRVAPAP